MIRYIIVSVVSGVLFGILDGVINANSLAQRLFEVYKPNLHFFQGRMSAQQPFGQGCFQ